MHSAETICGNTGACANVPGVFIEVTSMLFIERLWRTVKYDEIYLKDYVSLIDTHAQLDTFFRFYNDLRPHRSHAGATPAEVYNAPASLVLDA